MPTRCGRERCSTQLSASRVTGIPFSSEEIRLRARLGGVAYLTRRGSGGEGGGANETGAPAGGGPVEKVGHKHAAERGHPTDDGRTLRDGPVSTKVLSRLSR